MSAALNSFPQSSHLTSLDSVPLADVVELVLVSGVDEEQPATTKTARVRERNF